MSIVCAPLSYKRDNLFQYSDQMVAALKWDGEKKKLCAQNRTLPRFLINCIPCASESSSLLVSLVPPPQTRSITILNDVIKISTYLMDMCTHLIYLLNQSSLWQCLWNKINTNAARNDATSLDYCCIREQRSRPNSFTRNEFTQTYSNLKTNISFTMRASHSQ